MNDNTNIKKLRMIDKNYSYLNCQFYVKISIINLINIIVIVHPTIFTLNIDIF